MAKLKNITEEKKYIAEEMQSFKKVMSLRKTTSELNKDVQKEKVILIKVMMNILNTEDNLVILSLHEFVIV